MTNMHGCENTIVIFGVNIIIKKKATWLIYSQEPP